MESVHTPTLLLHDDPTTQSLQNDSKPTTAKRHHQAVPTSIPRCPVKSMGVELLRWFCRVTTKERGPSSIQVPFWILIPSQGWAYITCGPRLLEPPSSQQVTYQQSFSHGDAPFIHPLTIWGNFNWFLLACQETTKEQWHQLELILFINSREAKSTQPVIPGCTLLGKL